ncbi:MAG: hypothetical protein HKN12_12145, partial [Gemmatimonadetes bacterium]|nr:hypothetical protein [Gemmatimonadota bacterium]
ATDDANRAIRQLQELNNNILYNEKNGVIAADLEDRRDLLVSTIVELTGATAQVESGGTATVWLDEHVIVQRDTSRPLTFERGGNARLAIEGKELALEEVGGRIGGLLQARDGDIGASIERLDAFAARFAADVNAIHEQGVDEHGQAAGAFFIIAGVNADGVTDASRRIQVAADLVRDPTRVAAGTASAPGENGVELDIAALRNDPFGASGLLQSLVVDIGSRSREAQDLYSGQRIVVDSFIAQKESISGVNLDEEAAQLLQYQRAYEAAARVLTIADELTQTVLQL